jgi:hypothetical protein
MANFNCEFNSSLTAGVGDFSYAWWRCGIITDFSEVDISSGLNFDSAWEDCENLQTVSTVINSFGTANNFESMCENCSSLLEFPSINTGLGTNFSYTWKNCSSLVDFPNINTSSGILFVSTWDGCSSLETFPGLDVSSGEDFTYAWRDCSTLVEFPALNFISAVTLESAWENCSGLEIFPPGVFDSCQSGQFTNAFFGCALTEESVDNILLSLVESGVTDGVINLDGGINSIPGTAGLAAKATLESRDWAVIVNGSSND